MRTIVLASGLILNIAYGYNVRSCEDPFVTIADEATRNTVNAGGPGATLCDMFPACGSISWRSLSFLGMNLSEIFV